GGGRAACAGAVASPPRAWVRSDPWSAPLRPLVDPVSAPPRDPLGLLRFEVGEHGLTPHGKLPDRDQRILSRRKIDVHPRSEADQAEALAGAHAVALMHKGDD